ncbi:hypothetical protein J32TS6_29900 [Virgibacillus pantothenticus]|uniref:hypothetical protein n=1 Tax=Virgibacillus pantothenticus TaxID=1473 RepID=UPI00067C9B57|nr:hypothetical protein [Virgibacillus pantothenticus]MBU8568692.1 hypothetical protein [Virgibacillus pantothenticus]MBU8602705.1 hypothetical protein [Virgibacillus pantothenticus]MBU8636826.1 hypothetical protein [Virgibacillus pantothenticus]MBU8644547.1 hypothetical protein [Virgibacillus pantothenticus]MBU8648642.1 hypothetical protein [Virgibacillus pantothenticus]
MLNKRFILYSSIVLIFVIMMLSPVAFQIQTPAAAEEEPVDSANAVADSEIKPLTHKNVVSLSKQFMDTLVQPIHSNYRVKALDSKQELYEAFSSITTRSVAKPYVEYYYKEKSDGLFLRPTSKPAWFIKDEPYEMIEQGDNQVKVTQTNQTDFYGTYTIELEFTFENQWKITNIDYR